MENQEFKINKVRSLVKEVDQFHPFLKDLLPKLPNVSKVDYTHGTNEMGADFVVTVREVTLDAEEYIGLIVKSGNIGQDHDSLERQIKECTVPRMIDGGKRKIYLNQIWVISNGSISENAKKKIHEEYRAKNIKFIWDESLVRLVDKHYPEFWEDVDKNIGVYLSAVNRHAASLNTAQSLLDVTQDEFYIEQDIVRVDPSSKNKFSFRSTNPPTKLSTALRKDKYVLVEAGMGYGKSRLLRQAAIDFCNLRKFSEHGILPIFISFRDLVEIHKNSLTNILEHLRNNEKLDLEKYSLLFLVDSVDEIKGENQGKADIISHFVSQLMSHENMRVVFATRTFDDPLSVQTLDHCLTRYSLKPLSMQRLISFVEKLCKEASVSSKLKSDLQKSDLFKSLPKTPISAILLGRVLNAEINKELPSTLPELYSKYLELALGRWNINKGNGSEKEYETTVILVRTIAKFMFENDLPEIGLGDAESLVKEYLSKRETGQNAKHIFSNIVGCSEVFSVDEVKNKLFFRHRTFLEFMYAEDLFIKKGNGAEIEHPFDGYWGAVNFFYLGKLKDCPEQLLKIFNLAPNREINKLSKLIQSGSYLLAAYQSPYELITECVVKAVLEAADMFCQISDAPSSSRLGNFSEIHLLAVMTALMRSSFEYKFFERALRDAETDILLSIDEDKRKAVAAFFVAAVRAGLGNKDAFESLINEHLSGLPLVLRLGMEHASKDANVTNDALRRLEKKVTRIKKSNSMLSHVLYDIPMNKRIDLGKPVS